MTALAVIAVLLALPLVIFHGATLRFALALQLALYVLVMIAWRQVPGIDLYLAKVAVSVAEIGLLCLLLATSAEVRWSANRAAIVALLVYALTIPAMLRTPIDGDEPFYLLITESIVHDRDLDLSNQFRDLGHSAAGRTDLVPQPGDPVGRRGERYSRHEPFLPLLLVPGYLLGKLRGALAIIVLFGALLVRSTIRFLEDEGIDDATVRKVFPLFAFGPPVLFFAARIWPEVPAAFFFVEAVRGVRQQRAQRWIPALFALTLLKLRFILVAFPLLLATVRRRKHAAIAVVMITVPLLIVWIISGSALNVHSWRELLPVQPRDYFVGFFGLILDGTSGLLFQAPFYVLGLLAIVRWRETPGGFRLGVIASLLYVVYLVPRSEWHGGWAPPLRYIVIFTPVFALGAASMWKYAGRDVIALIAAWTAGLVVHGVAFPYRLFHIANGENAAGEALSTMYRTDFSRLFPSFIRSNEAAIVASAVFIVVCVAFGFAARWRIPSVIAISIAALAMAMLFAAGRRPGRIVQFEDAHVVHAGGELFPAEYTVARFLYRGGWILRENDSLSFLSRGGAASLDYAAAGGALIDVGGRAYQLPPASGGRVRIDVPRGRVTLKCVSGAVNLDSLTF